MGVREVVEITISTFESIGVEPLVGGSFASGAWGNPRQTNDIDLSARLGPEHEEPVLSAFAPRFMVGPTELNWALTSTDPGRMFSMTYFEDPFKIDVFVMGSTPYEMSELERSQVCFLFEGVSARVIAPENIVLQKLKWYVEGNRISNQQWNDVVRVIEFLGDAFDRDYLLHWADHFDLRELAEAALSEARP